MVSPRVSSFRLIRRGFGVSTSSSVGRRMAELATLRGKRVPAAPSLGLARLFQEPSAVRKWVTPSGGVRPDGAKPTLTSGGIGRLEVVPIEVLPHVREREDAGVERLAVPARPHPAAVAPTHDVHEGLEHRAAEVPERVPDPVAEPAPVRVAGEVPRAGERRLRWWRQQLVGVEEAQLGDEHVDLGGGVGGGLGEEVGQVRVARVEGQRALDVLRGLGVALLAEEGPREVGFARAWHRRRT